MEPMGRSIWQTARAGGSTKIVGALAVLIAVVVIGTVAAVVSEGRARNIAADIAEDGGRGQTAEIMVGTPLTLIPNVTLTITKVRWSNSLVYLRAGNGTRNRAISPSNPEFRLLVVAYEILNGSDNRLSRHGLAALLDVNGGGGPAVGGMDLDTFRRTRELSYGSSANENLLKIPPTLAYNGTWFFEMDSRLPNLLLTSDLMGFELTLPVDIHHPSFN